MELTKEYFESYLEEKLEQKLEEKLDQKLDEKLKPFATKQDLTDQTLELKSYVHESFEAQQVYIDARFTELLENTRLEFRLKPR